ncbi:MAG: FecR domain-containing protein [Chloroflexi bacterium]|nr:FecR domain-containing protein [Chloroflexota bacterium]
MKKSIVLLLIFFALVVLTGCQTEEETPPLSASMSELSGLVEMKQAGQESFAPASAGAVLSENGQIQTGDNGRVRLDLSTGTIIRVSPSSFFTLTSNKEAEGGLLTKIKLDAGKIFIILNGGQADVETPSGVASVRGSYMKVEVNPVTKVITITCLEGSCTASNPAGTVNFTNGQSVILNPPDDAGNWETPTVGQMTPEQFLEWLNENPEAKEVYDQVIAELTEEATEPAAEEAPTSTPTAVETVLPAGDASNACSAPQTPSDGSVLGKIGQVQFTWTEQPNAQYYIVTFVNEDGSSATIQTTTNSAGFYIEVLPKGGNYSWFVTAFGSDGNEICSSASVRFSKPKGDPTQKPTPSDRPERTEPATEYACTLEDMCNSYNLECFVGWDNYSVYCE